MRVSERDKETLIKKKKRQYVHCTLYTVQSTDTFFFFLISVEIKKEKEKKIVAINERKTQSH